MTTSFVGVLIAVAASLSTAAEPHAVFVVGTHHYSPQNSMPMLAKEMERFGFRTTVVNPPGNPEQSNNAVGLPGLEVLKDADVAVFFMRFLTLNDEQFGYIMDYVKSGKPVVGFRTSTHAFKYPKDHKYFAWNNNFGRDVLGTRYSVHMSGQTQCRIVTAQKNHQILTAAPQEEFTSAGTLYLTSLQPGCVPLVIGTGSGKGDRITQGGFGTRYIQQTETDIVAWTWTNKWGGRVFCSSFGHVGDFASEPIMRIIVNGICYAAGQPIPGSDVPINTFQVENADRKSKKR